MKPTVVCFLALALMPAAASHELLAGPELRGASVRPEPPSSAIQLLTGALDLHDSKSQQSLISDLSRWLTQNVGLPLVVELPKIAYAAPAAITAMRYRSLLSTQQGASAIQIAAFRTATVAIYVDDEQTIYLPDNFTGWTAAELSVLVHEIVHHVQKAAGLKYECTQAREKEAYLAQDRWLMQFGTSLGAEFEVDAFTVLVKSLCVY